VESIDGRLASRDRAMAVFCGWTCHFKHLRLTPGVPIPVSILKVVRECKHSIPKAMNFGAWSLFLVPTPSRRTNICVGDNAVTNGPGRVGSNG
jgi:hypothetical protein